MPMYKKRVMRWLKVSSDHKSSKSTWRKLLLLHIFETDLKGTEAMMLTWATLCLLKVGLKHTDRSTQSRQDKHTHTHRHTHTHTQTDPTTRSKPANNLLIRLWLDAGWYKCCLSAAHTRAQQVTPGLVDYCGIDQAERRNDLCNLFDVSNHSLWLCSVAVVQWLLIFMSCFLSRTFWLICLFQAEHVRCLWATQGAQNPHHFKTNTTNLNLQVVDL